jgi:DNA-binding YbaB/EbfC family protein
MGMGNLQRMAQQMQQEMLRIQTELEAATVDGSAGGGVVSATVTGKQELVSITIDPSAVDPEDVEMLQDMVVAAVNEAVRSAQELAESKLGGLGGDFDPMSALDALGLGGMGGGLPGGGQPNRAARRKKK